MQNKKENLLLSAMSNLLEYIFKSKKRTPMDKAFESSMKKAKGLSRRTISTHG